MTQRACSSAQRRRLWARLYFCWRCAGERWPARFEQQARCEQGFWFSVVFCALLRAGGLHRVRSSTAGRQPTIDVTASTPMTDEQRVVEICGCSLEAAREALIAAGPGGLELAVDLVRPLTRYESAPQSRAGVPLAPSNGRAGAAVIAPAFGRGRTPIPPHAAPAPRQARQRGVPSGSGDWWYLRARRRCLSGGG